MPPDPCYGSTAPTFPFCNGIQNYFSGIGPAYISGLQIGSKRGAAHSEVKRTSLVPRAIPMVTDKHVNTEWDAIVVGSGVGGLTTATEMARKGAKVLVLESYIIPGGSAGATAAISCFAVSFQRNSTAIVAVSLRMKPRGARRFTWNSWLAEQCC